FIRPTHLTLLNRKVVKVLNTAEMMLRLVLFALCLIAPSSLTYINTTCECNVKTIWLDVFLLMDASIMMGSKGISRATDYIKTVFAKLTVGQAEKYQTRLGVIRYASSVELVADLNDYTSTEDLFDLEIPTLNETGTNLDGAIRLARAKFACSSQGYHDPTRVAKQFRSDGGRIISSDYL
ncbi:hypothetical protein V3C99_000835, partial [Haemonchus contortus]